MKKILSVLISVIMLMSFGALSHGAESAFSDCSVSFLTESETYSRYNVAGNIDGTDSANDILILVTAKDKTGNIEDMTSSDIAYMNYFQTEEDGSFSFDITLPVSVREELEENPLSYQVILSSHGVENTVVSFYVPVTDIALSVDAIELKVGETDVLEAEIIPSNATDTTCGWQSSNESVATVDGGTVTAVGVGSTVITVTSTDGEKVDTCIVTVKDEEKVEVSSTEGGIVYIGDEVAPLIKDVDSGYVLSANAVPTENSAFKYWIDSNTKKILGEEEGLELAIFTDRNIMAVFADGSKDSECFVAFKGTNHILKSEMIEKGTDAVAPEEEKLYRTGFSFTGWDKPLTNITEETVFKAQYERKDITYQVTVTGGKLSDGTTEGTFPVHEKIALTPDEPSGEEVFAGWRVNGAVVSYKPEYELFVTDNLTIEAIFAESSLEQPVITMTVSRDTSGEYKVAGFLTERYLPESYTLKESGVIYVRTEATDSQLVLSAVGELIDGKVCKAGISINGEKNGQYKMNVSYGEAGVSAVGYMIYLDAENIMHVVYTEPAYIKD